jgi:hypothetical protein
MTRYEDKTQQIVADIIVARRGKIRLSDLAVNLDLATQLVVLALEPLVPSQAVDRAMPCGRHEPRTWVAWNARLRPLLESCDKCILRKLFGKSDIADSSRETSDERG